jgi:hypothetical protein
VNKRIVREQTALRIPDSIETKKSAHYPNDTMAAFSGMTSITGTGLAILNDGDPVPHIAISNIHRMRAFKHIRRKWNMVADYCSHPMPY